MNWNSYSMHSYISYFKIFKWKDTGTFQCVLTHKSYNYFISVDTTYMQKQNKYVYTDNDNSSCEEINDTISVDFDDNSNNKDNTEEEDGNDGDR